MVPVAVAEVQVWFSAVPVVVALSVVAVVPGSVLAVPVAVALSVVAVVPVSVLTVHVAVALSVAVVAPVAVNNNHLQNRHHLFSTKHPYKAYPISEVHIF